MIRSVCGTYEVEVVMAVIKLKNVVDITFRKIRVYVKMNYLMGSAAVQSKR